MEEIAKQARCAANYLQNLSFEKRNEILQNFITQLKNAQEKIEKANEEDKKNASGGEVSASLAKRLDLQAHKFDSCILGIQQIIQMEDPLGGCDRASEVATGGLCLYRISCPIGVLAVIFEARPEAAIQIASLSMKSGNALIMKGGKEAKHTNRCVYEAIKNALLTVDPKLENAVQLVEEREEVKSLLKMDRYIDLVIPRGSNQLVESIKANTSIPVLGHADGICFLLVDEHISDLEKAVKVVIDSKTDYPAACNALEVLLVHKNIAAKFVPLLDQKCESFGVKFRADEVCYPLISKCKKQRATEEDFRTEYLSLTMGIKAVNSIEEGIEHINANGSHHTDCILTNHNLHAQTFVKSVDSAGVYVNCSTRFADGFRYGFGAEVGISTNRIHARGPVGLEGLTIYKYRMYGAGHTVGGIKNGEEKFLHKSLDTAYGKLNAAVIDEKHKNL